MEDQPTALDWELKARTSEVDNDILTKRLALRDETISNLQKTNANLVKVGTDLAQQVVLLLSKLETAGIILDE